MSGQPFTTDPGAVLPEEMQGRTAEQLASEKEWRWRSEDEEMLVRFEGYAKLQQIGQINWSIICEYLREALAEIKRLGEENEVFAQRDVEANIALVALEKEVARLKSPEAIRARLCSCGRVDCNSDLC